MCPPSHQEKPLGLLHDLTLLQLLDFITVELLLSIGLGTRCSYRPVGTPISRAMVSNMRQISATWICIIDWFAPIKNEEMNLMLENDWWLKIRGSRVPQWNVNNFIPASFDELKSRNYGMRWALLHHTGVAVPSYQNLWFSGIHFYKNNNQERNPAVLPSFGLPHHCIVARHLPLLGCEVWLSVWMHHGRCMARRVRYMRCMRSWCEGRPRGGIARRTWHGGCSRALKSG